MTSNGAGAILPIYIGIDVPEKGKLGQIFKRLSNLVGKSNQLQEFIGEMGAGLFVIHMEPSFVKNLVSWTERDSPEELQRIAIAMRSENEFQSQIAKTFADQKSSDGTVLDPRAIMCLYALSVWQQERIDFLPLHVIFAQLSQRNITNEQEVLRIFVRAVTYLSDDLVVESPSQVAQLLRQFANTCRTKLSEKQIEQLNNRAGQLSPK